MTLRGELKGTEYTSLDVEFDQGLRTYAVDVVNGRVMRDPVTRLRRNTAFFTRARNAIRFVGGNGHQGAELIVVDAADGGGRLSATSSVSVQAQPCFGEGASARGSCRLAAEHSVRHKLSSFPNDRESIGDVVSLPTRIRHWSS